MFGWFLAVWSEPGVFCDRCNRLNLPNFFGEITAFCVSRLYFYFSFDVVLPVKFFLTWTDKIHLSVGFFDFVDGKGIEPMGLAIDKFDNLAPDGVQTTECLWRILFNRHGKIPRALYHRAHKNV